MKVGPSVCFDPPAQIADIERVSRGVGALVLYFECTSPSCAAEEVLGVHRVRLSRVSKDPLDGVQVFRTEPNTLLVEADVPPSLRDVELEVVWRDPHELDA